MKFIHLTDPHLVGAPRRLYGLDPAERLRLAVEDINRRHADAEFVLITGDLTHWGEPAAYDLLASVLEPLRMPCRLLIGNHDHRGRFLTRFPDTPHDALGFIHYAFEFSAGVFLTLDTQWDGDHRGVLCEHRLRWLQGQLESHPDGPLYLALHHAPVATGMPSMDGLGLANPDALWHCLAPHATRIRHVFFGHLHRPLSGSWHGIPFSTLRGTNHQVALDFEATGDIVTVALEPPSYAIVLVSDEAVVVHQHDFLDTSARFFHLESPAHASRHGEEDGVEVHAPEPEPAV